MHACGLIVRAIEFFCVWACFYDTFNASETLKMNRLSWLAVLLMVSLSHAQPLPPPVAQHNVAQLSVTGSSEAPQDVLMIVLSTTREGASAAQVQTQLSQAVEAALALSRPASQSGQPGQLEARTGSFNLQPRYNRDSQLTGWQGSAQVVLEGRDFVRITALAGRVSSLSATQVSFGLSPELQARLQMEAQSKAIAKFKQNAEQITRAFGLSSYTVREVSVNQQDADPWPVSRNMSAGRMAAAEASLPVEAGKGSISVTVSGSVQMQ